MEGEGRQRPVGLGATTIDHLGAACDALHLLGDLFADLEGTDPDVRTDRDDQRLRIVSQGFDRFRDHTVDHAPPPRVHRGHVAGWWMRDQDGDAIRGPDGDGASSRAQDEGVPFERRNVRGLVVVAEVANLASVNLPLLEQLVAGDTEGGRKATSVLGHGSVVVAEISSEVEGRERRTAHAASAIGKPVAKAKAVEKTGTPHTHTVFYITAALRARGLHATRPGSMHRFPSEEWTQAYKNAINQCRAYREVGKAWTFGSVAMIIKCDLSLGLERDTAMVLDVHEGCCRGATFIEGTREPAGADFIIVASYGRWKDVIEGELDPIKGMMEGKLKLTKGSLATLVRFVESSRQLVTNARNVPTEFLH